MKEILGRSPDHCLIAGTKILTVKGNINIEDIKIGDKVITPFGIRKVLRAGKTHINVPVASVEFSNNKFLVGTLGHKIYTDRCFHTIDTLMIGDKIEVDNLLNLFLWRMKKLLSLMDGNIGFRRIIDIGMQLDIKPFTEIFGNLITNKKFLKDIAYTILIEIPQIMISKIWNWLKLVHTVDNTESKNGLIITSEICKPKILKKQESKQVNGIKAKQVENGIVSMAKTLGKIEKRLLRFVLVAVKSLKHFIHVTKPVVINVGKDYGLADVYNLTIEKDNVYYANGILVSNSDTLMMRMYFELSSNNGGSLLVKNRGYNNPIAPMVENNKITPIFEAPSRDWRY